MKINIFNSMLACLAICIASLDLQAIDTHDVYIGIVGSKIFESADSRLSAATIDFEVELNDGINGVGLVGSPFHSAAGSYNLNFVSGNAFGITAGFELSDNMFFEGEFSHREKVDKIANSWPSFLTTNGQIVESIVKSGFANLGYYFNLENQLSPFVSLGVGIACVDIEGEFRLPIGNNINPETADFYELHKNSEFRGRFVAESDLKFAGNFKAGIVIPAGKASALVSYRYTTIVGYPRLDFESATTYKKTHSWTFEEDPSVRNILKHVTESDESFVPPIQANLTGNFASSFSSFEKYLEGYSYSDHGIEIAVRLFLG